MNNGFKISLLRIATMMLLRRCVRARYIDSQLCASYPYVLHTTLYLYTFFIIVERSSNLFTYSVCIVVVFVVAAVAVMSVGRHFCRDFFRNSFLYFFSFRFDNFVVTRRK